jgi:large subunit ribosomal protein L25
MSEIVINANIRTEIGKRAKELRRKDQVPGIYYAQGQPNIPISMSALTLNPLFRSSATHIITLKLDDGSSHLCIMREIQVDPLSGNPIHFDLLGIKGDSEITIEIPIVLRGIPKGVKDGGVLNHMMHRLRVSCLPKDMPDKVEINVESLEINRSIHVSDLSVPNVRVVDSPENTVAAVNPPTVIKEPEPVAVEGAAVEAAPAEPEVIAKGKKTEEGEEAPEKE